MSPIILKICIETIDWRRFVVEELHWVLIPDNINILEEYVKTQKADHLYTDDLWQANMKV